MYLFCELVIIFEHIDTIIWFEKQQLQLILIKIAITLYYLKANHCDLEWLVIFILICFLSLDSCSKIYSELVSISPTFYALLFRTRNFFVLNCKVCTFWAKILTQKLRVKCWWNWLLQYYFVCIVARSRLQLSPENIVIAGTGIDCAFLHTEFTSKYCLIFQHSNAVVHNPCLRVPLCFLHRKLKKGPIIQL